VFCFIVVVNCTVSTLYKYFIAVMGADSTGPAGKLPQYLQHTQSKGVILPLYQWSSRGGTQGERRSLKYFAPPFGHLKIKKNAKLGVTGCGFPGAKML